MFAILHAERVLVNDKCSGINVKTYAHIVLNAAAEMRGGIVNVPKRERM